MHRKIIYTIYSHLAGGICGNVVMIQYMENEKRKEIFICLSLAGGINLVCFSVKNVNVCLRFFIFY